MGKPITILTAFQRPRVYSIEKEREEEREDRKQAMQSIAENNLNKNQEMGTQPQVKPKKNIKYHKPVNYEFESDETDYDDYSDDNK